MSNPAKAPKFNITEAENVAPDAYYTESAASLAYTAGARSIEQQQAMLEDLDMDLAPSIVIPKELTVCPALLQSSKIALAKAKAGKKSLRVRSGYARTVTTKIFPQLPGEGFGSQAAVGSSMRDKVFADGGTEYALGRLKEYYPKKHSTISHPPSRAEAEQALRNCGADIQHLPNHAKMPFPLISQEDQKGVTVNPKSDNGFPVLGQFGDPVARAKCLKLAVNVRDGIKRAFRSPGGVWKWVRDREAGQPYLVAFRGKAKGDYYNATKLDSAKMRFYNALPRQIMLNMQVATQPYEQMKVPISKDVTSHSGVGMSLVRDGADLLVHRLDDQLLRDGIGYVHVGDDSWVAMRIGEKLVSFALDCSSFDLTQHSATSAQVHQVVREQLSGIDAPAADLWYALARERLVVVTGTLVRRFKHAGPSGMPLQSLVNDLLMDILITRTAQRIRYYEEEGMPLEEDDVNEILHDIGEAMGFVIKIEQFRSELAPSVRASLRRPFLFVGYYFTNQDDRIMPFCDLPRTMAQMPYPSLKWMHNDAELQTMEAMRIGSILMSAGVPPKAYEPAFNAFRDQAIVLLKGAIVKYGDRSDESLRWAVQSAEQGAKIEPSLSGLLEAVQRDPRILWMQPPEKELEGTSVLITDWADATDRVEIDELAALGITIVRPLALPNPDPFALVGTMGMHVPTHPATSRNDGRPPPTAEWLPDKPKKHVASRSYVARIGAILPGETDADEELFDAYPELTAVELSAFEKEEAAYRKEYGESLDGSVYLSDDDAESLIDDDEYIRRVLS